MKSKQKSLLPLAAEMLQTLDAAQEKELARKKILAKRTEELSSRIEDFEQTQKLLG
ncbi:MAG: hypothetical protein V1936_04830 [Patescibacteria group bacterium]